MGVTCLNRCHLGLTFLQGDGRVILSPPTVGIPVIVKIYL